MSLNEDGRQNAACIGEDRAGRSRSRAPTRRPSSGEAHRAPASARARLSSTATLIVTATAARHDTRSAGAMAAMIHATIAAQSASPSTSRIARRQPAAPPVHGKAERNRAGGEGDVARPRSQPVFHRRNRDSFPGSDVAAALLHHKDTPFSRGDALSRDRSDACDDAGMRTEETSPSSRACFPS